MANICETNLQIFFKTEDEAKTFESKLKPVIEKHRKTGGCLSRQQNEISECLPLGKEWAGDRVIWRSPLVVASLGSLGVDTISLFPCFNRTHDHLLL